MNYPKLMTAVLSDGSQITGTEIAQNIYGDEVILMNDEQEILINMQSCISYSQAVDPVGFDELSLIEAEEIDKLNNLSALLTHQAY